MNLKLILAAAAALAVAGSASAVELIQNGGFENGWTGSGYYNIGPSGSGADHPIPSGFGWSVPVNNVDIVTNGDYGPYLTDGQNYVLDLVGYGSTGAISQTFYTEAGKTYTVSFEYAANGGVTDPTANVTLNGSTPVGSTITGGTTWQTFNDTFTGTGGATVFTITEGYGANSGGVFLDNISVTGPVPEPATWALMIGGLGLTGFALRRRAAKALAV